MAKLGLTHSRMKDARNLQLLSSNSGIVSFRHSFMDSLQPIHTSPTGLFPADKSAAAPEPH
jgi:hypothetical protein